MPRLVQAVLIVAVISVLLPGGPSSAAEDSRASAADWARMAAAAWKKTGAPLLPDPIVYTLIRAGADDVAFGLLDEPASAQERARLLREIGRAAAEGERFGILDRAREALESDVRPSALIPASIEVVDRVALELASWAGDAEYVRARALTEARKRSAGLPVDLREDLEATLLSVALVEAAETRLEVGQFDVADQLLASGECGDQCERLRLLVWDWALKREDVRRLEALQASTGSGLPREAGLARVRELLSAGREEEARSVIDTWGAGSVRIPGLCLLAAHKMRHGQVEAAENMLVELGYAGMPGASCAGPTAVSILQARLDAGQRAAVVEGVRSRTPSPMLAGIWPTSLLIARDLHRSGDTESYRKMYESVLLDSKRQIGSDKYEVGLMMADLSDREGLRWFTTKMRIIDPDDPGLINFDRRRPLTLEGQGFGIAILARWGTPGVLETRYRELAAKNTRAEPMFDVPFRAAAWAMLDDPSATEIWAPKDTCEKLGYDVAKINAYGTEYCRVGTGSTRATALGWVP